MSLPNDAYGHVITMTTDGTNDYYLIGGSQTFSFPAGTNQTVAYLSFTKQLNLQIFMLALQTYVQNFFSTQTQLQFVCMYLAAQSASLTNRVAYIAQLLTWLNAVEAYAATYVGAIQALSTDTTVAATAIDTSQISAAPTVTLIGAISIPN